MEEKEQVNRSEFMWPEHCLNMLIFYHLFSSFFFMLVPSQVTSSAKQHSKIFVFTSSQLTYLLQYDRKEHETYLLKFIRNIPFLIYKGRMKGKW